jgi:Transposase IS66 family
MPPGSPFGSGIIALVTYLHGCQMVGYARLAEMLKSPFGLKISEGAIANMLARTAEPFAECAQTIHETVRNSPVIASDETSARLKGKTHWQWTFVTASAVLVVSKRRRLAMLAFGKRVGPDLFAYAPICPEVGAATPPMGYRWSGAIALGECRGLRGTKKTELIESN